ncbi:MAG: phosphatidate cytidylyltransferase [Clostridia bacterium]|nr:phosphatidate cytidylyltransferase [Clostridia bacterium]
MKKRLITGTIILLVEALFLFTVRYTPYAFDLFIGVLAVMGCVEVTRVLERKKLYTSIIFVGSFPAILYIAMSIGLIQKRPWHYFLLYFIVILIALFVINFLVTIIFKKLTFKEKSKYEILEMSDSKYAFTKCMNSSFVMVYPALLFASFFVMTHFFDFAFVDGSTLADSNLVVLFFLIYTFVVTIVTDSMAYVVGSTMKGPKLCPIISPNKTISGAVGGLVFGMLGGLLTYYLFTLNSVFKVMMTTLGIQWWYFIIIGTIVSIIGQAGDIVASALKRSARVKDYGTIFPGHGGVMDRVDGLIFNALAVVISMFIIL